MTFLWDVMACSCHVVWWMGINVSGEPVPSIFNLSTYIPPPPMVQQHVVGQGFLIIEASRYHTDTPHSVGLLSINDQPDAETST
jgi:hypothetical protein